MSSERKLSKLLLLWEQRFEQGKSASVEELCRDCPELMEPLRQRIHALEAMRSVLSLSPLDSTLASSGTSANTPGAASDTVRGRYRLEKKLGEGGLGQVWRAYDPLIDRTVAIKLPRADRSWSQPQLDRFLAEARKIGRLRHPGILPVYDVGEESGKWYIVSMLVEPGDLGRWVAPQGLPAAEAVRMVADVAEALQVAHQEGLVHRDVKPGNILVDERGRTYLTDFGLAATLQEQRSEGPGTRGTLPYMAPEQAAGSTQPLDGRADIYSLGIVLYELLTGRRPFQGTTWPELAAKIIRGRPQPPSKLRPDIPAQVEQLCLKCLSKQPGKRPASAAELADALRRCKATAADFLPAPPNNLTSAESADPPVTLRPLNFAAELDRLAKDFTGREWLDNEFELWLQRTDSRIFLVTGDPGSGKSAYLAHIIAKYPQAAAHHFCIAGLVESLDPFRFVTSVGAQLAARREDYRQALARLNLDSVAELDAAANFRRMLGEPLRSLSAGSPVVLVVDALDEAMLRGATNIAQLLRDRFDDLPAWVRLIASTRKEPEILDLFSRVRPHEIDVSQAENLRDVTGYLQAKFREPRLIELIRGAGCDTSTTIELIARKGTGNFLYVTQAVEAMLAGQISPDRPDSFPDGLVGIYQAFFERVFPKRQGFDAIRPLLEVIIAAREPLTPRQIATFLGRDEFEVAAELQRVAVMFPEQQGRHRPCHKSLTDWLCGLAGRSKTYRVNVAAGHRSIADQLLQDLRADVRDPFLLSHLPTHLIEAGRWAELEALLTDLHFVEAKCAACQTFALVTDYNHALAAWPSYARPEIFGSAPGGPPPWLSECTTAVLGGGTDPHGERGSGPTLALLRTALADHSGNAPAPPLPAPSEQAEATLAEIRRTEYAAETGSDPTAEDSAPGRIQTFAVFVSRHSHFLQQQPRQTIPLAWNQANSGILAERAAPLANGLTQPWIARDPRPMLSLTRPASFRLLRGHTAVVGGVALSADGRLAISASADHTLRLWDVSSGESLGALTGHTSLVNGVSLTPDGRRAVSAGKDGTVRVWDVDARRCEHVLRGHISNVLAVAVAADGSLAVSGSRDRTLRIWDLSRGTCVRMLECPAAVVMGVALTPDGRLAVSTDGSGFLRVWDVQTGQCLRALRGHTRPVRGVAISADGRIAASAGLGRTLRIWDLMSGECLHTLPGHNDALLSVALSADAQFAASVSQDGTMRVWDARNGECLRVLDSGACTAVALTPDARLAVSGGYDQSVRVWDVASGTAPPSTPGHTAPTLHFAWSGDGKFAVSGSRDRTARIWHTESRRCVRVLRGHNGWVHGVAITPDQQTILTASWDVTVGVWDLSTGQCVRLLEGHTGEVRCVVSSANGKQAASSSFDQTVRVWDLESGQCLQVLRGHTSEATCVALTPDGKFALSGSYTGTVRLYDLASGKFLFALRGHDAAIMSLAVTADGKQAISASKDQTIRVWDLSARQSLCRLQGHTDEVAHVQITPDGLLALSASMDGTARVWDLGQGICLATYYAGAPVRSISSFWPGGEFCCGTINGAIHRLNLRGPGADSHGKSMVHADVDRRKS